MEPTASPAVRAAQADTVPVPDLHHGRGSIRRHYQAKTAAIIERYGPGPRVHYHIGLYRQPEVDPPTGAADKIRARIVEAQDRLLDYAALVWNASEAFGGSLLDVGCGLGGGTIYWAQRFPVRVTAITNVPEHAALTQAFAAEAGVADQVCAQATDIRDLSPAGTYSAAVAIESSCYIRRLDLFHRVGAVLGPGAVFGIEDIFLAQDSWRGTFDQYWKTRIGTIAEYQQAARQCGFALDQNADVTPQTAPFWLQSTAWARARLADPTIKGTARQRLVRSINWHSHFYRGWRTGAYQTRILRFVKQP